MLDSVVQEWSQSIWTLPELLLSQGDTFTAYHDSGQGASFRPVKSLINKRGFARQYISDPDDREHVQRLVNHYLGNLKLSELELMAIALPCFSSRLVTSKYLDGDYSYALMGLLGRRPC
jgi:hypothetical protein